MPRKKTVDVTPSSTTLSAVPRRRTPRTTKVQVTELVAVASACPSYDEIAEAAYLRFLSRGGGHGADVDDWVEAERELSSRRGYAKAG
jgi:hypothetical protein